MLPNESSLESKELLSVWIKPELYDSFLWIYNIIALITKQTERYLKYSHGNIQQHHPIEYSYLARPEIELERRVAYGDVEAEGD